jgi:tetratricopeptide (TPR) repeat protein
VQWTLGKTYATEGYHRESVEPLLRSVALYRTLSEPSELRPFSVRACLAAALASAGFAFAALQRYEEADRAASEAVALARVEPYAGILAWALISKSLSATNVSARRELLDEALGLGRSLPSGSVHEGLALIGLALAEFDAGDIELAQLYAAEAAEYFRCSGLY